jgi:hypothetical protein
MSKLSIAKRVSRPHSYPLNQSTPHKTAGSHNAACPARTGQNRLIPGPMGLGGVSISGEFGATEG